RRLEVGWLHHEAVARGEDAGMRRAERYLLDDLAGVGDPNRGAAPFQRPQRSVDQPGEPPARGIANLQRMPLHARLLHVDGDEGPLPDQQPRHAALVVGAPGDDFVANHRTEEAAGRYDILPPLAALEHQEPPEDDRHRRRRAASSDHGFTSGSSPAEQPAPHAVGVIELAVETGRRAIPEAVDTRRT